MARTSMHEYLDVIQHLQEESEAEVSVSAVAKRLGVSRPSVSEMVKKLTGKGLVQHARYGKISLTAKGQRTVRVLSRRHRLWQNFLMSHLGLDEHHAHRAACELEHATSSLVERKLSEFLGDPDS